MLQSPSISHELIMFWDDVSVAKTMLFDDFEATLSGLAPMAQYSKLELRGAYLQLDETLTVRACALFLIHFDRQGYPDNGWNIPLKHIVEVAGLGPDMGRGPIRLACRSQCPISWHAPRMWDPIMQEDINTFEQIKTVLPPALERWGLRAKQKHNVTETDIPVLTAQVDLPLLSDLNAQEMGSLQQKIQDLQLKLQTLVNDKERTVSEQAFVHQQQIDILEAQNQKLIEQMRNLKSQSGAQQERISALQNQVTSLSSIEETLWIEREQNEQKLKQLQIALSEAGEAKQQVAVLLEAKEQEYASKVARMETEYLLSLDKRLEEEASRYVLSLKSLQAEVVEREESIKELEHELENMQLHQVKQAEATADAFLRKLQGMGMNFVAFHPGLGNLSVPVDELVTYVQNPTAYVAAKCLVTEEHYQTWLKHYESPRCMAEIGDNKCCNARLIRIDSPSKFILGQSDHCARHQGADTAILNVLKFR